MIDEKHIFNALSEIENTSVVKAIKKFSGSLLVIASENDGLIPLAIPETIIKEAGLANRKELVIMKNASHALIDPKQGWEFTDIITDWFKETLI